MKRTGSISGRVIHGEELSLEVATALREVSAEAPARDSEPAFPDGAFRQLADVGALGLTVPARISGQRAASLTEEWAMVQSVARSDGSVGRIYDGHLNAVERLAVSVPEPLRSQELERVAAGELLLGVWGADPVPGADEGEPARLVEDSDGPRLEGVKVFCSGAGGLDAALVLARGPDGPGPPWLVYADLSEGAEVDRSWYRSSGMRSSESHRVVFDGARVLAVLGGPGEISREPYFGRDAIRTAASWAGVAQTAAAAALGTLAAKSGGDPDEISALAAGRIVSARETMRAWFEFAARRAEADPEAPLSPLSIRLRSAVAESCREILDQGSRACGSRPFAVAGPLDRARRDLEVFLLQHRLEPLLAREGRREILAALEPNRRTEQLP